MNKYQLNLHLLCAQRVILMSLFPVAIITIFWKSIIGMSMTEIMISQAVFGIAVTILEFPAGYLADRISYRLSIIVGMLIMSLGWIYYCFSATFIDVILSEIILGVGITFISGTDSAILYESLLALKKEKQFSKWSGRILSVGQIGEGSAALVAGISYAYWYKLPFVIEAVVFSLGIIIALLFTEPPRQKPRERSHIIEIKKIVKYTFVKNKKLRVSLFLACLMGLATFYPVWIIQLYTKQSGVSVEYLGPIWAIANFVVAIGAFISYRLEHQLGSFTVLLLCIFLAIVGYGGLGFTYAIYGFGFYYLINLMRGLNSPVMQHILNKQIPSENRAGMLSLRSMITKAIFAITGPIVGIFIDQYGNHNAFLMLGGIIIIAIGVFLFKAKKLLIV